MGQQYDLFERPAPMPAVDRAYDEGKMASMQNQPAKPPYDPSVPQYGAYMQGFHDHQATLAGGIKPLKDGSGGGEGGDDDDKRDLRPRHLTQPDASRVVN
jgi:hypothetical protein